VKEKYVLLSPEKRIGWICIVVVEEKTKRAKRINLFMLEIVVGKRDESS